MRGVLAKLLLLTSVCLPGCLSVNWSRGNRNEPISDESLAMLNPGEADLTLCLTTLGAPTVVWEYQGDGMALAYAWIDSDSWGLSASYSVSRYAPSAAFSFDSRDDQRMGVVLMFDADLTLNTLKRGRLGELVPVKRRPSPLPEDIRRH